jgi:hypothetical protein
MIRMMESTGEEEAGRKGGLEWMALKDRASEFGGTKSGGSVEDHKR